MAKAKRLASGSWNVRVYAGKKDGKQIIKSFTAPTKREAEYLAAQWVMHKKESPLNKTVEQALINYIESRSNILSPATIREYKREARIINADIGDLPTNALDTVVLQRTVNKLSATLAPHTVRNYYHLLVSALNESGVSVPSGINLPQKNKVEIEIPTDDEVRLLIASAEDKTTRVGIMLAAYCGMRRGEICALKWQDFDGERITVCRDMVQDEYKDWVFKSPKTYAGFRTITVPQALVDELNGMERTSDRIIQLVPDALYNRYVRLLKRTGIKHYSFHALRHYHASLMLSLNIPNKYAAERMGHSTDAMLKRVYQHIVQDKMDEFSDKINAEISKTVNKN